ncbi:hypothetical protein Tco_0803734 [Tanacetum coccineum]|uniref:Uncharacterized protein n=1 Tax=Tanacetum coccineum TaxID=301880 RepID=A0ABQ5A574_9ASTR
MDEDIQDPGNKETQSHHSTKNPTKEPISTEHQSPSPNKDDPKPSHVRKSADASYFESSSCFKTFKPFVNYMAITERQLEKHEGVAASYADLRAAIEGFAAEAAVKGFAVEANQLG